MHPQFQQWCWNEILQEVLAEVANALRAAGAIDVYECFIDATIASANGDGNSMALIEHGKGVTIIAVVDRHGLPLSASTHASNHHEMTLAQLSFDFYMIKAKPENLIGDTAYDSEKLGQEPRKAGIDMIAPHRSNRVRHKTKDDLRQRRYQRHWIVKHFFSWMQWQWRLLVRLEYHPLTFLGFAQLASIVILLMQF